MKEKRNKRKREEETDGGGKFGTAFKTGLQVANTARRLYNPLTAPSELKRLYKKSQQFGVPNLGHASQLLSSTKNIAQAKQLLSSAVQDKSARTNLMVSGVNMLKNNLSPEHQGQLSQGQQLVSQLSQGQQLLSGLHDKDGRRKLLSQGMDALKGHLTLEEQAHVLQGKQMVLGLHDKDGRRKLLSQGMDALNVQLTPQAQPNHGALENESLPKDHEETSETTQSKNASAPASETETPASAPSSETETPDSAPASETETPAVAPPSDNPIDNMESEESKVVQQIRAAIADTTLNPDAKTAKVDALQEKLQELSDNAKVLKDGLVKENLPTTNKNVATSGGGNQYPDVKYFTNIARGPMEKDNVVRQDSIKVEIDKTKEQAKPKDKQDLEDLETIQNTAAIEIARADVKLVYDYVQKTSDPRALKALFQYQEGKDKETDKLSKHFRKINDIYNSSTASKAVKDKAKNLLNDIKLARVKLYSVNVDAAIRRIEDKEEDINFFPDELKSEMSEKQKRITNSILVVFAIIRYTFKQFAKAPTIVSVFTLLSFVTLVISAYLAYKYCILIINDYTNNKLINNPTNAESLDFLVANFGNSPPRNVNPDPSIGLNTNAGARSATEINLVSNPILMFFIDMFKKGISPLFGNLLSARYKYAIFVILPWISLIFASLAIIFMIKKRNNLEITPGLVQVFLYAGIVQTLIALVANHSIFFYAYYVLRGTSFRIDSYNKHVLANMIQRADFLAYVQKLPTNTIAIANVTGNALATLFKNGRTPTEIELSKAIFTLNLYEHYQQLGYRNPLLYEALDSFRIYNFIFSQQTFSPALYLRRNATLIRDNGEKYRGKINTILQKTGRSADNYRSVIDNAIIQSSQMTAEANNLANAFFPEDAMSRFLIMAVVISLVQFLPYLLFMYLFRKKDLRNGFIDAIRIMIGQKKKRSDADIVDQEEQVSELRELMKNRQNTPAPTPTQEAPKYPVVPPKE